MPTSIQSYPECKLLALHRTPTSRFFAKTSVYPCDWSLRTVANKSWWAFLNHLNSSFNTVNRKGWGIEERRIVAHGWLVSSNYVIVVIK